MTRLTWIKPHRVHVVAKDRNHLPLDKVGYAAR